MKSNIKYSLLACGILAILLFIPAINLKAQNQNPVKVEIYPNPVTSAEFSIKAEGEITEVVILNVLGQAVYTQQFIGESNIKILLDARESGLYLIQVKTSDGRVTTKRILFK